jgi:F1F0 ATPase subunit 2
MSVVEAAPQVLAGLLAGTLLGLVFFGGLWITSALLARGGRIGPLLVLSYAGRMALLALGLVGLARLGPAPLLGAAPGLVLARTILTRAALRPRLPAAVAPGDPPGGG